MNLLPVSLNVNEFDFCFGDLSNRNLLHSLDASCRLKFSKDPRDPPRFLWMSRARLVGVLRRLNVREHSNVVDESSVGGGRSKLRILIWFR